MILFGVTSSLASPLVTTRVTPVPASREIAKNVHCQIQTRFDSAPIKLDPIQHQSNSNKIRLSTNHIQIRFDSIQHQSNSNQIWCSTHQIWFKPNSISTSTAHPTRTFSSGLCTRHNSNQIRKNKSRTTTFDPNTTTAACQFTSRLIQHKTCSIQTQNIEICQFKPRSIDNTNHVWFKQKRFKWNSSITSLHGGPVQAPHKNVWASTTLPVIVGTPLNRNRVLSSNRVEDRNVTPRYLGTRVPWGQLLRRQMKRFRGGLVWKAHRVWYHSTLGQKNDKYEEERPRCWSVAPAPRTRTYTSRR